MVATEKKFTLRHIFKNVSQLEDGKYLYSPDEDHFNVDWNMSISHKKEKLGVYFYCYKSEESASAWSIDTEYDLALKNSSGKRISIDFKYKFSTSTGFGTAELVSWDAMIKDYLIDDVIIMEATVKIINLMGIPKKTLRTFDESNEEFSDVILTVEDEKFYVLKQFLASHSSHFKTLFLRKCEEEAEKSEYTLQDINSIDFQNLLEVLHGEPAIDEETVQGIRDLADKYDMPFPTRKCEEFLIDLSEKSIKEKLKIAKQFQLEKLKMHCLSKIETVDHIKAAMTGDPIEMDLSVLAALLGKSLALH
ncbi:BTB domain-containing protein [Caenorhabditis elegans]|uniref:BTB domain-containing protein n=1 Tax=Caenorhabditis elegans TaxID=6239 RepID=Q9N5P8_CAEEL|nr:BTB domain-containing protein [Caenorhabditis elegans]CCD61290.1 BTB domain-containing protein [Caenorhabditis elegans]|eukprot:NP_494158.1 BTB and MATH domain containing [Caenorhabditis elegans]